MSPRAYKLLQSALALGAGLAFPYTFAPTDWWPIAPASLIVLYLLLQSVTPSRAGFIGWLFGLGYFGIGVSWVYHSLHLFGAAIAPLAAFLTLLFVLVMTVFPALTAWAWVRLRSQRYPIFDAALFAALWVISELLRGKIMGGFPWILAGYSQTSAPLGDLAPVVGVYGISFVLLFLSTMSASLIVVWRADTVLAVRWKSSVLPVLIMGVIVASAALIGRVSFSEPVGSPLAVRLVQANIPQEMKFSQERLQNSLQTYAALTREPGLEQINLVVWPETAIPTYFDRVEHILDDYTRGMDEMGIDVLSGGFHREGDQVFNSVRQLGGDEALYQKRHLVPFGEFMPLRFLLDHVSRFIDIPMSDLTPGSGPHVPLDIQGVAIGVSICYEDVYGEEMRALVPASTLLVNVSNDAWFGASAAPHQHEQKARMRARELARPLIRVTNTGVSSAIDERGRVSGRIAHDTQGILDVSVVPRTGTTPYAYTGNWPVFLVSLALTLLAAGIGLLGRDREAAVH